MKILIVLMVLMTILCIGILSVSFKSGGILPVKYGKRIIEDAKSVEIEMNEFNFSKKEIIVKKGENIHFILQNSGIVDHNFHNNEFKLNKDVYPGLFEDFYWTVPNKTGTYTIFCDQSRHKEKGMTMKLIIE
jgi:heme/copper-type cytochrome/quinol oxidase subunit 2